MPAPIVPREEAVGRLLETFRRHGYEGATLRKLCAATGLGRSSLYHHFPGGKRDMALAVLDQTDAWVESEVVRHLRGGGPPRERLGAVLDALAAFYANGAKACILGRLACCAGGAPIRRRVKASFEALRTALQRLCREAGVERETARHRAEDALVRLQGALVVSAGLGETGPFTRAIEAVRKGLLADGA
jgi:AcrR family transcriptional regulator